jgi:high-affinity Fe2+/Pb2+ permease
MLSGYAKAIVVIEERSSALLAFVSSLGFCARNVLKTCGLYLSVVVLSLLLLSTWAFLDAHWTATGYRTQFVALFLGEGLVLGRILLRLVLLGSQVALYRAEAAS